MRKLIWERITEGNLREGNFNLHGWFVYYYQASRTSETTDAETAKELRLMRTILERLECSFAKQEVKLDRIMDMMAAAPVVERPSLQYLRPSSHQLLHSSHSCLHSLHWFWTGYYRGMTTT